VSEPRWHLPAAILVCFAFPAVVSAQISPGSLSRPHQSLSGPTHCTACHRVGSGEANFRCLECHTEIASRVSAGRGLHATYISKTGSGQNCIRCHSEHNGEDFSLIRWEPSLAAFDHSKTGYPLEGKHAGLACGRCHTPERIAPAERQSIRIKDLKRTFLGLSRDCATCHVDKHKGQLGPQCQQCHTLDDWKAVTHFDHAKTRYPLTGLHARVACQKCHQPAQPGGPVKYVGLPFSRCSDCHTDPHRGTFQASCQSCHNTGGWKRVTMAEKFDHSRTKYPLLGKHASVDCAQCHTGGDFKRRLAFQRCADCHKPDPHSGQFAKRRDGGDCASCHTVDTFKPARFGLREHAATAYPLEGKHSDVPCAKCHLPAARATLYRVKFTFCTDCHQDPHQGQFARGARAAPCESCHTLRGYRPSTFTIVRHKTTRFPLTGGHVAVPCGDCHKPEPSRAHPVRYHFEDRACTACHADPHRGQFRERMLQVRADGTPAGCEACHSTASWKQLSRFDHALTDFPLVGAHRGVACIECHKPPNLGVTLHDVDFRVAPKQCENCHEDIHGAQFARAGGVTPCAECHNSARWRPSLFDHEKRTTFPLQGAHRNVRCAACHKNTQLVQGKTVLFYKPTPRACAACHGPSQVIGR